jgi:hypothetical protein
MNVRKLGGKQLVSEHYKCKCFHVYHMCQVEKEICPKTDCFIQLYSCRAEWSALFRKYVSIAQELPMKLSLGHVVQRRYLDLRCCNNVSIYEYLPFFLKKGKVVPVLN